MALKKGNEFIGPKKQRHAKYLITHQDTPSRPAETAAAFLTDMINNARTLKKAKRRRLPYTSIHNRHINMIIICCCCGITFINVDLWLLFAVLLLYAVFLRMIAGRGQLEIVI